MKANEHNLLNALKELGYDAKVQQETGQVFVVFQHEKQEFPIFLRILHEGELLQFLTFIPVTFKQEVTNDLARLLHMINKELDAPGFCIDESTNTIFYRLIMTTFKKELNKDVLEAFMNTTQVVCKSFATVIEALAIGAMSLTEILQKAQEFRESSNISK
jgi:hypothetical protein